MTYKFPSMDMFEKALDTLDEEDIAEIREDYLYNVFISEILMSIEDNKYSTPIFEFSPKKVKTDTEIKRSVNDKSIDIPRINSNEIKKCDLNRAIKLTTVDNDVVSSRVTSAFNTKLNNIGYDRYGKVA